MRDRAGRDLARGAVCPAWLHLAPLAPLGPLARLARLAPRLASASSRRWPTASTMASALPPSAWCLGTPGRQSPASGVTAIGGSSATPRTPTTYSRGRDTVRRKVADMSG